MSVPFHLLVLLTTLTLAPHNIRADDDFQNTYEGDLIFECPDHQMISGIYSVNNDLHEDRRWQFSCGPPPSGATPGRCTWSHDYVNSWGETISFLCPPNWLLTGAHSYYSDNTEDRRWKFKCCKDSGYLSYACKLTPYLNVLDGDVDYKVPNARVLTGWFSVYDNTRKDRILKVQECSYKQ